MASPRVSHESAFVLHQHDWSESSLILDVFTRHHGRVALAAKGVKRPTSGFRAVLLPLQPLSIGYGGDGEIKTLKSAEWLGGHVMPGGDALLAGLYANELLMRLLARDDAHARLFDLYAQVVHALCAAPADAQGRAAVLRAFELLLLQSAGLLPALDHQTLTGGALDEDAGYCLTPEGGLRAAHAPDGDAGGDAASLPGARWLALALALADAATPALPAAQALRRMLEAVHASGDPAALRQQTRLLLHYHCGVAALPTRRVMMELHNL